MVAHNSPDWLPSGWTVQFKVQKTGRKIRLAQETNERPEWLPKGWTVVVKVRNSGSRIGSKYKCYIDPLNGYRFYSKPQVFQYLKTVKCGSWTFKKSKTDVDMPLAVVEKQMVEDLPAGWTKEIKIRQNAYGIRRDPFYKDPENGYLFRSKKDALRYLETGEISRYTFKPKESCINNEELINSEISPSSTVKRQKLNHPATKRRLFADQGSSNKSSLELAESKSSKRGRENKVSAEQRDAFGPTVEIVQDKHSMRAVKESAETKENRDPGRPALPKSDRSKRKSQPENLAANNEHVSTPAVDILQEKNDLENVKERGSGRKNEITLSKSKYKKEFNLPCRSSKRLAGLEPGQVVNSVTSQKDFQVSTSKFGESGSGQISALAPYGLSNGAFRQLDYGKEMVNAHLGSTDMSNALHGDPSSQKLRDGQEILNAQHGFTDMSDALHGEPQGESKKPLENEAASKGQLEMLDTEKMDCEKEAQEYCCPFGNSWFDPCLEFAIKTLTGALPLEDAINNRVVLTPADDILEKEKLLEGVLRKSNNRKTQVDLRKSKNNKELNLPRRSSKRLAGFEPELLANSLSSEHALKNASRQSCESEATLPVILVDRSSQQLEDGLNMELAHHDSNNIKTQVLGESSNKSKMSFELQIVPKEQPQVPKSEILPEPQLSFPLMDSWSDPCLEFAIKTLTGAIPVEDNLAVQGTFQEQLDISHTRRNGGLALPDFGLPRFFQNDISSHLASTEQSVAGNKPSMSSFLAPGNVSLPSCEGIGSQKPCSQGDHSMKG
ncbi:uncharacterized protein LOC121234190 isoform X2 [Juglans microcarpa x Juglans regia]|uniref:uncharacterized protein LOC121234190 isoform X2 n=1 Tax=Juglans microcarpa x Juglans regia TaxID=2249226 RepID=UPI001B7DDC63|nr:uncharacterized protein LOC121234190 isoform X2 [Juglans microcarpa x Juglans regia]